MLLHQVYAVPQATALQAELRKQTGRQGQAWVPTCQLPIMSHSESGWDPGPTSLPPHPP